MASPFAVTIFHLPLAVEKRQHVESLEKRQHVESHTVECCLSV